MASALTRYLPCLRSDCQQIARTRATGTLVNVGAAWIMIAPVGRRELTDPGQAVRSTTQRQRVRGRDSHDSGDGAWPRKGTMCVRSNPRRMASRIVSRDPPSTQSRRCRGTDPQRPERPRTAPTQRQRLLAESLPVRAGRTPARARRRRVRRACRLLPHVDRDPSRIRPLLGHASPCTARIAYQLALRAVRCTGQLDRRLASRSHVSATAGHHDFARCTCVLPASHDK